MSCGLWYDPLDSYELLFLFFSCQWAIQMSFSVQYLFLCWRCLATQSRTQAPTQQDQLHPYRQSHYRWTSTTTDHECCCCYPPSLPSQVSCSGSVKFQCRAGPTCVGSIPCCVECQTSSLTLSCERIGLGMETRLFCRPVSVCSNFGSTTILSGSRRSHPLSHSTQNLRKKAGPGD